MAITTPQGFDVQAAEPIDVKYVKTTVVERNDISLATRYQGLKVYVLETGLNYQLQGGIQDANWTVINNPAPSYWEQSASTYGNRLSPIAGVKELYLKEDNQGLTQLLLENANDATIYAGAFISLKGSGAANTNTGFIGKFGAAYHVTPWQGHTVVGTDKNLFLAAASGTSSIIFQAGGTLTAPVDIFTMGTNGLLSSNTTSYEALVTTDNSIPNRKYITDNYYTQANLQTSGQSQVHWGNVTNTPGFISSVAWGDITGDISVQFDLQGALLAKENAFTKSTAFNSNFGTGYSEVARGNHTHVEVDITDLDKYTQAEVDALIATVNEFSELTDVTGAYTTANALYRTNGTTNGLEETTILVTEPVVNQFQIARGTSALLMQGNLTVESASFINQDLTTDANVQFTQATLGNSGLIIGASIPFSDAAGTLTLQNIDALDTTTETTIENAIDTLINLTSIGSSTGLIKATGGTLSYITDNSTDWDAHIIADGSSHTFINQDVTSTGTPSFNTLNLATGVSPSYGEGLVWYDNINKTIAWYDDITGTSMQGGQENILRAKNDEAFQINNGDLVYINDNDGTNKLVKLARADMAATSVGTIAMATHDIAIGAIGKFTRLGTVNDLDTQTPGFIAGETLYLSATTAGAATNVAPTSPNFRVVIGTCAKSHLTTGQIEIQINAGSNTGDVIKIFNGDILEHHLIEVTSNGTIVTLTLDNSDTVNDLSFFFNGMFYVFTAPASITLTAGSDSSPTHNYVYVPESTRLLTVSTVGWPAAQHARIATVIVQSAASLQTDGAYKVHAWTNHLSDINEQGHVSHVNSWIRKQPATWESGVTPSTTIVVNGGAKDDIYFAVTSGMILQLHDHNYPARNVQTGDPVWVVNDFATSYNRLTNLNGITTDSTGGALHSSNNTYYSVFFWGSVNEADADCKLYANAPSGSYSNSIDALIDPLGYTDQTIPSTFVGTGFPIARVVYRYQNASSGTITEILTESLLTTAGGGGTAVSVTEFSDNAFKVHNVLDSTKELAFDISGVTTATTRTLAIPDISGTLAVEGMTEDFEFGGQAHGGSSVEIFSATKTFDAVNGNNQSMITTAATTIGITNELPGTYIFELEIDNVAGAVITIGASFGTIMDNSAALISADNGINIITLYVNPSGAKRYSVNTITA